MVIFCSLVISLTHKYRNSLFSRTQVFLYSKSLNVQPNAFFTFFLSPELWTFLMPLPRNICIGQTIYILLVNIFKVQKCNSICSHRAPSPGNATSNFNSYSQHLYKQFVSSIRCLTTSGVPFLIESFCQRHYKRKDGTLLN